MSVHMEPCKGGCGKPVPDEGQYGYICWACWKKQRAPTPEAAATAPVAFAGDVLALDEFLATKFASPLERQAWARIRALVDGRQKGQATASPGEAPADLREAVALAVTDYSAGGEDISHTVDRILSLVHPQAPKAAGGAGSQAPGALRWTKEKPTREGWYWYRQAANQRGITEVYPCFGRFLMFAGDGSSIDLVEDAEWAGPIPEPAAEGPAGGAL